MAHPVKGARRRPTRSQARFAFGYDDAQYRGEDGPDLGAHENVRGFESQGDVTEAASGWNQRAGNGLIKLIGAVEQLMYVEAPSR